MKYLERNKDITHLSNFRTPAVAQYYFELMSMEDIDTLTSVLEYSQENKLPVLFIGGGTNMLFAFDIFTGIVIKNSLQGWEYDSISQKLVAYSNEWISDIASSLENDYGQPLWHRFIGLPGSIGGAIYGNAGCFGLETENNFVSTTVYNKKTKKIEVLKKQDMKFSYRNSYIKDTRDYIICSAEFDLSEKVEKYHSDVDNIHFREHKQPKGNTCGSFFKNPSREHSAGMLIEQAGLKGKKIGGAYFSDLHANFLMHDGNGGYQDLLDLIALAQERVHAQTGISIIPEVQIITC